jgi:selenide,water dikinase
MLGLAAGDDAAVFQLNDEQALVQSVDFFPPIVDDPYVYGAIAAANALSDIYAMGGRPFMALAIAAFPDDFDPQLIAAVIQGGADKVAEAGAVLGGGHTVSDREPKFGLAVSGLVDPRRVTARRTAQPGDRLLLSKPIGSGLITTAARNDAATAEHLAAAVEVMLTLNRRIAELAVQVTVHAATDITGFGLLGHAAELVTDSVGGLTIEAAAVPLLPGALEYAAAGETAGGLFRNREHLEAGGQLRYAATVSETLRLVLHDPQTSGGLLLALPPAAAAELTARCEAAGQPIWAIGEVTATPGLTIV